MAFITRLSRLLRADLHAMLDRLEAPELVLAQAVRDMEQAHAQDSQWFKRLEQEGERLARLKGELTRRLEDDTGALNDCLAANQDDLARAVIRRRLEAERSLERLDQQWQENAQAISQARAHLAEQDTRLSDLRSRAELYASEPRTGPLANDIGVVHSGVASAIRDADVEVALLQAKRQREARA